MLRRDEEIDVTKHAAARLVEDESPQTVIFRNPARLFPDGIARRWLDAVYDDVADFAFGMTADDVYDVFHMHGRSAMEARV